MWPELVDLNLGETRTFETPDGPRTLKLEHVRENFEADHWCKDNPSHLSLCNAVVHLEVDGVAGKLLIRPYQMPVEINGLRLYGELTRRWARGANFATVDDLEKDARFSVLPAAAPWGPSDLRFPLAEYRWRSSTYMNTWLSLVPWNHLYYHRGEDFGAIPNKLPILALRDGAVHVSPLPDGDGRSNGLGVDLGGGVSVRYAHMDLASIDPALTEGATVRAGQHLAMTGQTWNAKPCQSHDPHLHLGFHQNETRRSPFPFLVEAYFRDYDDPLLPIAGGFAFTVPGEPIDLDGSRSQARPGRQITAHRWKTHDGAEHAGERASIAYDKPGLYAEELIVTADDGSEDRDALHVCVYDPARENPRDMPRGWVHYTPARQIEPGTAVTFWNRLSGLDGAAQIDFGDGTPACEIEGEIEHAYAERGVYTVTLRGRGTAGDPATTKIRVRVE